ncbi:methyltransferase family protein [Dehalogenimonas etheniformans]
MIFGLLFALPFSFLPPDWPWFYQQLTSSSRVFGAIIVSMGCVLSFGTMLSFGLKKAFGLETSSLVRSSVYNISRNPQIVGGWFMVIGISVQFPSFHSIAWVVASIIVFHLMVLSEEEHLIDVFGTKYKEYAVQVPRYLFFF